MCMPTAETCVCGSQGINPSSIRYTSAVGVVKLYSYELGTGANQLGARDKISVTARCLRIITAVSFCCSVERRAAITFDPVSLRYIANNLPHVTIAGPWIPCNIVTNLCSHLAASFVTSYLRNYRVSRPFFRIQCG